MTNQELKFLHSLKRYSEKELKEALYRNDLPTLIENEIYPYDTEAIQKRWRLGALHEEWNSLLRYSRIRVLAPRDHLKTFFFTIGYSLLRLYYTPDDEIYILSKKDDLVVRVLDKIKKVIRSSPFFRHLEGRNSDLWNKTEIRCNNGATLYAQGYWSSIRGGHPKLIILDDPIDTQVIYSDEINKKSIERFVAEILPMAEPDTQIVMVGTLQREDDLYSAVGNEWVKKTYDAIIDENQQKTLFPEKWPWDKLMQRRAEIVSIHGERFWLKEYRNIPIGVIGEIIKKEWIHYYRVVGDKLEASDDFSIPINELRAYAGWDLSVGKDPDKASSDYTAGITIQTWRNKKFVWDVFRDRIPFPQRLQVIQAKWKEFGHRLVGIESNNFQYDTIQELKDKTNIPLLDVKTTTNKNEKFSILLGVECENGRLYLKGEKNEFGFWVIDKSQQDFLHEILSLPRSSHDDMADALCIALSVYNHDNRESGITEWYKEQVGKIPPRSSIDYFLDLHKKQQ